MTLEVRLTRINERLTSDDRSALLVTILLVAFLAFTGVAAMVPGGLAQAGGALGESNLLVLAAGDALVAGLLGYRAASLRVNTVRDALWSALTYATAIAIGAAALRAMAIPALIGPALLTLAFYLWDAFIGTTPASPGPALDRADRRAARTRSDRRGLEPAAARLTGWSYGPSGRSRGWVAFTPMSTISEPFASMNAAWRGLSMPAC